MDLFPAFWRLKDRRVLLTGNGDAALNKLRLLSAAGARVVLFAPDPSDALVTETLSLNVEIHNRPVTETDIGDAAFGVVADDAEEDAIQAAEILRQGRLPVNAVDRPALCDFSVPAIVDRGAVVVGVATGGASPILAQRVRQSIEAVLPARLDSLALFARDFRNTVMAVIDNPKARRRFWERVIDGPIATDVLEGRDSRARERMLGALNGSAAQDAGAGRLIVLGVGPGDPEHLTLKALRALLVADVVVFSNQDAVAALDYARRDVERLNVPAGEVTQAAKTAIANGQVVIRLVTGDGKGEATRLSRHLGIFVDHVPGVATGDHPVSIAQAV